MSAGATPHNPEDHYDKRLTCPACGSHEWWMLEPVAGQPGKYLFRCSSCDADEVVGTDAVYEVHPWLYKQT